jgi:hypothetical protein
MTTQITDKPRTVRLAQGLFGLNTFLWLVFGIMSILRLNQGGTPSSATLWVVAILMFGNTGAMLISGIWLGKRIKLAFFFALAVLGINILLTFTDQVGFLDILTALIDFGLLGLLLFDRRNYF